MTFFSPNKLKPRRIEIDSSQVCSENPAVKNRLIRIEENYVQLDSILAEIESKIENDERLKAIDDANVDFELTFGIKKKRKWSPVRKKSKSRSKSRKSRSPVPKKPR